MVLLSWIEQRQRASLPEIVEQFGVSPATARRDLDALAESGRVQRVRGGALALHRAPPEAPVYLRADEQQAEKRRIAAAAAVLIEDGDTVFLGSGTTVEAVARLLVPRRDLTVLTNSLLVLNALAHVQGMTVIALGGALRASELSFVGPLTMTALRELRAFKVVMGIRAIDASAGLTNAYLDESLIDRAIIDMGSEVIIVADSTKCGRVSTVFVAPINKVGTLVTDSGAPPDFVAALRAQGIRVLAA